MPKINLRKGLEAFSERASQTDSSRRNPAQILAPTAKKSKREPLSRLPPYRTASSTSSGPGGRFQVRAAACSRGRLDQHLPVAQHCADLEQSRTSVRQRYRVAQVVSPQVRRQPAATRPAPISTTKLVAGPSGCRCEQHVAPFAPGRPDRRQVAAPAGRFRPAQEAIADRRHRHGIAVAFDAQRLDQHVGAP
jgi:hypothetical protein